ncbi:MAG: superoxide dismutase family protein, partial [Gammaproteobacteria bacterium]|nr:superoxide dismutase family protein [Gammaproteobacteria bacterium]
DHGRAGQGEHHVGDSDNLMANDEGVAEVGRQLHGATIGDGAATDIVGKGVIVHAGADDYVSQPTGDAGDRLACGVIKIQ